MSCNPRQKKLCGVEACRVCWERSFASHARAAQWSGLNVVAPYEVTLNCNKVFLFDCDKCEHLLEMSCNGVVRGSWCRYCNKGNLCEDKSCEACFKQSFASHPMAAEWSPKNHVTPRQITIRSDMKAWFDCKKCGHSYELALYSINKDKICRFCTNQALCGDTNCAPCMAKSCAQHPRMVREWHKDNPSQPHELHLYSNLKMQFNCEVCHHVYATTLSHYAGRDTSQCTYCANVTLCKDLACQTCYQKSFASHPRMDAWSKKNVLNPRLTFKGSDKKAHFICNDCKSLYITSVYNVVIGAGCPFCVNKTETIMQRFLAEHYTCSTQARFSWCRSAETKRELRFDFLIDKVLIELDGEQHFSQVSNWSAPEETQKKDVQKIKGALENGYSVIHLLQMDVWKNVYDWKTVLRAEIEALREAAAPQCVFLQSHEKYGAHAGQIAGCVVKNPQLAQAAASAEEVEELEELEAL